MKGGLCYIEKAWAENHLIFRGERRPYRAESVMVEANVRAESVNQCRKVRAENVIFAIDNDQGM